MASSTSLYTRQLDNDTRGWIMTCISGVACVLGAGVICVDLLVRLFPRHRAFRIQDSNGFLSCSLSLSAGVMLFSSLYSMLPNAKSSLQKGGHEPSEASWIMIGGFLAGVFGIQIFSDICHRFIPHQAVDCDHSHDVDAADDEQKRKGSNSSRNADPEAQNGQVEQPVSNASESTPLLSRSQTVDTTQMPTTDLDSQQSVRPALPTRVTTQMSRLVAATKHRCDADGHCYGWSDPCSQDCFRNIHAKGGSRVPLRAPSVKSTLQQSADASSPTSRRHLHHSHSNADLDSGDDDEPDYDHAHAHADSHHHHVPQNAFLSISLQTSVAIALHKLPEGFITYATNHANPKLGLTVFLALFIHNLTEGFALALPIFLATQSRLKAMALTLLLGGLSQPAGAGVAALWLKLAERNAGHDNDGPARGDVDINPAVNGAMFAVTSGIMASVAVSLLAESFELTHSRRLCSVFCFIGMAILGCSTALTA